MREKRKKEGGGGGGGRGGLYHTLKCPLFSISVIVRFRCEYKVRMALCGENLNKCFARA